MARKLTEKQRAARDERNLRRAARIAKRKLKRETKAAPKRALAEWAAKVTADDVCAICGIKSGPVLVDGQPKMSRSKDPAKSRPVWRYIHAHHILPFAGYREYRFEPMNGIPLCPNCHKFSAKFSAHKGGMWFAAWLQRHRPQQYAWVTSKLVDDLDPPQVPPVRAVPEIPATVLSRASSAGYSFMAAEDTTIVDIAEEFSF